MSNSTSAQLRNVSSPRRTIHRSRERAQLLTAPDTASPYELTCQELVELVTDYLDGALTPVERLRFEEHISVCPPCRRHLRQIRETIRLLGTLTEDKLSPEARTDLMRAFRDWKEAERP